MEKNFTLQTVATLKFPYNWRLGDRVNFSTLVSNI